MADPRNISAALETIGKVQAERTESCLTLREVIARCRLRNPPALAVFGDDEVRELIELALGNASLPTGAVGEAALAYLVAYRKKLNPVPFAVSALARFDSNDDESRRAVVEWLGEAAARALAQANALQSFADAKFGRASETTP